MFSVSCAVVVKKNEKQKKFAKLESHGNFIEVFFFTSKQRRVGRIWTVHDGELKLQSKGIKLIFTVQKCQFVM